MRASACPWVGPARMAAPPACDLTRNRTARTTSSLGTSRSFLAGGINTNKEASTATITMDVLTPPRGPAAHWGGGSRSYMDNAPHAPGQAPPGFRDGRIRLLLELQASRVPHPSDWVSSSRTRTYTAGVPTITMAAHMFVAPFGFRAHCCSTDFDLVKRDHKFDTGPPGPCSTT